MNVGVLDEFTVSEQAAAILVGCVYESGVGGIAWIHDPDGCELLDLVRKFCEWSLCCVHRIMSLKSMSGNASSIMSNTIHQIDSSLF